MRRRDRLSWPAAVVVILVLSPLVGALAAWLTLTLVEMMRW